MVNLDIQNEKELRYAFNASKNNIEKLSAKFCCTLCRFQSMYNDQCKYCLVKKLYDVEEQMYERERGNLTLISLINTLFNVFPIKFPLNELTI